jgi:ABC-type enterochelin transport system permease subunit
VEVVLEVRRQRVALQVLGVHAVLVAAGVALLGLRVGVGLAVARLARQLADEVCKSVNGMSANIIAW